MTMLPRPDGAQITEDDVALAAMWTGVSLLFGGATNTARSLGACLVASGVFWLQRPRRGGAG